MDRAAWAGTVNLAVYVTKGCRMHRVWVSHRGRLAEQYGLRLLNLTLRLSLRVLSKTKTAASVVLGKSDTRSHLKPLSSQTEHRQKTRTVPFSQAHLSLRG